MSKGRPGADSTTRVDELIAGTNIIDLATAFFGEPPIFWGRYFKSLQQASAYEYRHRQENPVLNAHGIKLLPLAQQTVHVGGSSEQAVRDGKGNVEDFIASIGVDHLASNGSEYLMFLDVEPSHPLSAEYYSGWATTIVSESLLVSNGRFQLMPCVYLNRGDGATWRVLEHTNGRGQPICSGLWVASYSNRPGCTQLIDWDDAEVRPDAANVTAKILIWQYTEECHGGGGFDCNQTNPDIDLNNDLLNRLILPPIGV